MNILQVIKNFIFLNESVQENVKYLQKLIKRRKGLAFFYRLTMLVIAASITLVLGLNLGQNGSKIALILSSLLTVLATLDQFEKYTTKYISLNKRLTNLVKLGYDLNFYLTENNEPTEDKFLEFKDRYFSIIDAAENELSATEASVVENVKALSGTK